MKKEHVLALTRGALLVAIMVAACPDLGWAQAPGAANDLGAWANERSRANVNALTVVISVVCWIIGLWMIILGALGVKDHAENREKHKLAPALAKLVMGGLIGASPFLVQMVSASIRGANGSTASGPSLVSFTSL